MDLMDNKKRTYMARIGVEKSINNYSWEKRKR